MTKTSFAQQTDNSLSSCLLALRKSFAFTLAEVLITLAIIGIVAAMTLPTLIANHQKQQTVVQLRKVYSDLANVIRRSEVDNGPSSEWSYPMDFPGCDSNSFECEKMFFEKYYLPYLPGARFVRDTEMPNNYTILYHTGNKNPLTDNYLILNNGVIFSMFGSRKNANGYIWLFADINGIKGPNKVGRDIFVFDPTNYAIGGKDKLHFWCSLQSVEALMDSSFQYSCNAENTDPYRNFCCGRAIELSGWKIPPNYPW